MKKYIFIIILLLWTCDKKSTEPEEDTYLNHTVTATQEFDQSGGTITDQTTGVSIQIPENALNKSTTIEIGIVRNIPEDTELHVSETEYHFGPDSLRFNQPVLITIPYDPDNIPSGIAEQSLQIQHYDKYNYKWNTVGDRVDISKHEAYAQVDHFSYYAVRGNIEPEPVELFEPTKDTYNSVILKWSICDDADFWKYDIYMSESHDVNLDSDQIATITSRNNNELLAENLKNDTEYYFKVYTYDKQDLNIASNVVSFRTEALKPLLPVALNDPTNLYPQFCDLSWSQSQIQNFKKYTIRYSASPDVNENSLIWPNTHSYFTSPQDTYFELQDMQEGTQYYFKVFVDDFEGNTVGSNEISFTTPYWTDISGLVPDPNFAFFLGAALNDTNIELTHELLATITRIDWAYNVYYIKGIEHCVNLEFLELNDNYISDISFISNLTNITELYLPDNRIIDISAIENMTNINILHLFWNDIIDISPISNLTNVTDLRLYSNNIVDISSISNLSNLEIIGFWNNQISDISVFGTSDFPNLIELDLSENNISDVSVFENTNFPNILSLGLSNNNITDLGPIVGNSDFGAGFTLNIQNNPLNEISINTYIPELQNRGVWVWF